MHLSLQGGWTALMMASEAGHTESVQVLLDKGADVNMQDKVSGVIIHCVHAMQHASRVPSSRSSTLLCCSGYRGMDLVWRQRPLSFRAWEFVFNLLGWQLALHITIHCKIGYRYLITRLTDS